MYYKNNDSLMKIKKIILQLSYWLKMKNRTIQTNILSELQKYTNELIIIDGHSEDGTYEYAMQFSKYVYKDNKKGKGDAIRMAGKIATDY